MRRHRRRPKVVWLKNTGSLSDSAIGTLDQASFTKSFGTMAFGPGNPTTLVEIPLVVDNPKGVPGALGPTFTLTQYQAQALDDQNNPGYRLIRCVGDLHIGLQAANSGDGTSPGLLAVTASIIVRRVDENGVAIANTVSESANDSIDNIDDPFVWRRMWLLACPIITQVAGTGPVLLPNPPVTDNTRGWATSYNRVNNFGTGVNNTVSVDTKSKRRIAAEERLFLDVCFTHFGSDLTTTQDAFSVNHMIVFDYRVLAQRLYNIGNRKNASR